MKLKLIAAAAIAFAIGAWGRGAYAGYTFTTLDDPLATGVTYATGISGTTIVGAYVDRTTGPESHGFVYNGSTWTTLNDPLALTGFSLGGTVAMGISGSTVAGFYTDSSGSENGFIYNGTTYMTMPGGGVALGISGGTIVGYYGDSTGIHGFTYDGTTYTLLNDPSATRLTEAYGISGTTVVGIYLNSAGQTCGFSYDGSTLDYAE